MSAIPGPVYGLEVPPGEILIPAGMEIPASVSLDMDCHCSTGCTLNNLDGLEAGAYRFPNSCLNKLLTSIAL